MPLPSVLGGTPSKLHKVFSVKALMASFTIVIVEIGVEGPSWLQLWFHKRLDRLPRI